MSEVNKKVILQWAEIWSSGNTDMKDVTGIDSVKHSVKQIRTTFSDLKMEIEDIVAEGDKVAACFKHTGRHTGEFHGIAPQGRQLPVKATLSDVLSMGRWWKAGC